MTEAKTEFKMPDVKGDKPNANAGGKKTLTLSDLAGKGE